MEHLTTSNKKWYAVYTLPRLERNVHDKITELGVESFLPTKKTIKKWSDRIKKVQEPLFPNYVFVKTTLQHRFKLFNVTGLVRFISFEGQPVEIPENDIERVKRMISLDCDITSESYRGKIGEKVLIQKGQFAGIEGVISKQNGKRRLIVQIEALKQLISVDLPSNSVSTI